MVSEYNIMAVNANLKNWKSLQIIICVLFISTGTVMTRPQPVILSARVLNVTLLKNMFSKSYDRKILIELNGTDLEESMPIVPTTWRTEWISKCKIDNVNIKVVEVLTNRTTAHMAVYVPSDPNLTDNSKLLSCLIENINSKYHELNSTSTFRFSGEVIKWAYPDYKEKVLLKTESEIKDTSAINQLQKSFSLRQRRASPVSTAIVYGLRVELPVQGYELSDAGVPDLVAFSDAVIRLYGSGFTAETHITFTSRKDEANCEFPITDFFRVEADSLSDHTALVKIRVPQKNVEEDIYYVCVKDVLGVDHTWKHQGAQSHIAIHSYEKFLPTWVSITIIVVCLCFSALFSGLNLGLMSLDQTDLKIVANTGSEAEKRYANAIIPVRASGNYLLCSILIGNVLVNSSLTILLDDLTTGVIAILGSTICIVLFGEITPQAICSRHGLAVGAKTIYITKLVMILTFPVSYPVSKILDLILGVELGTVYTRERLKELVKVTTEYNDLEKDEVNIISGALELRRKTVKEVMTKLDDAFMLNYDSILDFETVSDIMKQGFSRIPVYEGERTNIITTLFIKDLAFVDPDDCTPLKTLCKFYQNPCNFVFEDMTLDIMFRQFKEGIKGHMAFVHRVNSEGEGDPYYETVGLVTLEDVIEELIQSEIVDETDVWTDNRNKRRRNEKVSKQDFTIFAERRENQNIHISPQLTLATFQYMSANVDAFKPEIISETILRRLLTQDVIYHVKVKNKEKSEAVIYKQGKAVDYFVLILEGRVEVLVGKENMRFESGPFTYFGTQALTQNIGIESPAAPTPTSTSQTMGSLQSVNAESQMRPIFVPDYTVRAITEVFYIRIKRSLYQAAKQATLMELAKKGTQSTEHFDDEVEKLLHSLDDEGSHLNSPTLSHKSHQLSQNDKNALQRCIEAAERGGGLTGNDMSLLQSLSSGNGDQNRGMGDQELLSPSRVMTVSSMPDFCTQEPNGSVKSISPISINKSGGKSRKVSCAESGSPVEVLEERTSLLPQSGNS